MTRSLDTSYLFPASYGQQRLWFLCQLDPSASQAYHLNSAVRVTGRLDVDLLHRALDVLLARHEALRTRMVLLDETEAGVDDRLAQVISTTGRIPVTRLELTGRPAEEVRAALAAENDRPFDLEWGPLLRGCVARLGPDEHVLLLTMHHIIGDGWSLAVLGRELSTVYSQLAEGREPQLPELAVQYADFAEWQRDRLSGPEIEDGLDHWTRTLAGLPDLDLPTDRPRPMRQSYRGARVPVRLPADLVRALTDRGRAERATPFMVLLAAWQAVLGQLAGQADFGVGTPVAGRSRPELEGLIGFFVNTVVLRADLSGRPSFTDLLRRVRDRAVDAFVHQDVPFEKLVERLAPHRDLSRPPLFQVGFAFQNTPGATLQLPGARVEPVALPAGTAAFDLNLVLHPAGAEIAGWLEYNRDLFDERTARRVAGYWRTVLTAAVADPQAPLWTVPMLSGDELGRLRDLSGRDVPPPPPDTVPDAFAEQARRAPQAPAVRYQETELSYGEVSARANRLAHWLRQRGIGTGDVVGVCLPRTAALPVTLLAVWRAGAAYLPLDPDFPAQRRELMVTDSGTGLVLTEELLAAHADRIAAQPETPPAPGPRPGELAYVIYTSGSTGRPKGVLVPHGALAALVADMAGLLGLLPGDVWAAVTTVSFDIAALELFGPLATGGCVAVLPRCDVVDPEVLSGRLTELGADIVQATPALWRSLTATGWRPDPRLRILCGGEALPADLAATLAGSGARVWNVYGPTETAVWSTAAPVTGDGPVTLGRPLPGEWTVVLDGQGMPVPPGAIGELYIGGAGVAWGYHARPGLTAQRFLPDPTHPGRRMYRTGDLVRHSPEGDLVFLGRRDDQIKLRGYRVELGEVESVLCGHSAVRAAAAALRGPAGNQRLVGYLVPADPARPPDPRELARYLRDRLPEYMVPGGYAILPELPRTPNGKLDRAALPAPDTGTAPADGAPRTELQRHILQIWQRLLERHDIGIHDNFFHVGGYSMLAARLVAELRRTLNVRLSVGQVFVLGTVEQIATALSAPPSPGGPPGAENFDNELAALWDEERRLAGPDKENGR